MNERAIIVDDKDQVVAFKDREELELGDRYRITGVWVENGRGQVLIALRGSQSKNHPNVWGAAAGGAVASDEDYEGNAYREAAEEIGLRNVELKEVGSRKVDYHDGTKRYCMWYRAIADRPAEEFELEDKVERVVWVNKDWLLKDVQQYPDDYLPSAQHWPELFSS